MVGESCSLFLWRSPFFTWCCVATVSQLLPRSLWDVGTAVPVRGFSDLGLHILRQNTHNPDIRDFRWLGMFLFQLFPHSQEPPLCLYFSDHLGQLSPLGLCLHPQGKNKGCTSFTFLLTAAALFNAQFSSFQCIWVFACSLWISSARASLASSSNSPIDCRRLCRPDPFVSFLTSGD